jgi:hypothetical protein
VGKGMSWIASGVNSLVAVPLTTVMFLATTLSLK